ncbi:hypothetical protein [Alienimonas sp. DA493]|uniref:hypothetical protein n=1 Tax=Alienimonas sp. DA493 TaxID=3373605 RepID=UPI0037547C21
MPRSGRLSRVPRRERSPRERIRRTASVLFAAGLIGAGLGFTQPPADAEAREDATEVVEPAAEAPDEAPAKMRAPDDPGVELENQERGTGGSTSLADAVRAYNGTAGGKEVPLTVEAVAAAIRRGFQGWDQTTIAPYAWVLKGEEAPRGGRVNIIRLDPSAAVNGATRFVELSVPGALTIFQFPIPQDESPAVPRGPTLAEAAEAFNRDEAATENLAPVTVEEIRAGLERYLQEERAKAEPNEAFVRRVEATLAAGRLMRERDGLTVVRSSRRSGEGGPARRKLGVSVGGVLFTVRDLGLSDGVRDRIAAALVAAADDDELPFQTRLHILRETVEPGSLTAERTRALFDRLEAVRRRTREVAARRTALLRGPDVNVEAVGPRGVRRFFRTADVEREWDALEAEGDRLAAEQMDLLRTLSELGAVVPGAAAARTLAATRFESPSDRTPPARLRRAYPEEILARSVADAAGLRAIIAAARDATAPGDDVGRDVDDAADPRPRLYEAIDRARPTNDSLAEALLDAAQDADPKLRAAALEALAGLGGD